MKCNKCGSSNVVTKIVIQNDKGTEEINLCLDCFQKFLKDHPDIQNGPAGRTINDFLLGAMNYLTKGIRTLNQNRNINIPDTRICPNCSAPVQMIKKDGRTGCAKCYEFFSKEISDRLFYLTGKRYGSANDSSIDGKISKESIRERIKKAVKSENYEIAAELTKELKKLK